MKRKIFEHIIVGLAIGFIVTTASLWAFRLYDATGMMVMRQFTTWLVASALYGLVSMIYDSEIPFPISFGIHFVGCAAITFAASVVSGIMDILKWYEWFIYVLPVFVIIYIIIGAAVTLTTKCQEKLINKKMRKGH